MLALPHPRKAPRRFSHDRSGAVAVYVALAAAATLGIVGLAIDASRVQIVRSEAQAAADAAALSAASQLDGTPTAISRANTALANLVSNQQQMASTGAGAVTIASVRYLSGLPASDDTAIGAAFVTTDPLQARYVEVTTTPLNHQNSFLRAVSNDDGMDVSTRAVGGAHQMVCRAPPIMICNPAEANGNTGAAFDISVWRGRQIRLVSQATGAYAPGNFGYLTSGSTGANALADALASVNGANICYGTDVETEPGQNNGTRTALNTRLGIYENPQFGGGARNSPLYAPDVNVRTMPRDLLFDGRFGNGHWDCLNYWNANFSGSGVQRPAACANDSSAMSRYQMYQYEIAHNLSQAPTQNAANKLADRRIIYVAVVNCVEEGVNGRVTVPSLTYLKVFLTEPVTEPSNVEVYAEVVDVVQVGVDDTVLHDIVQLYR